MESHAEIMHSAVKYQTRTTCELRHDRFENCMPYWQKVVRLKDHDTNLGEFDVYLCQRCKLGFTEPYPTEETSSHLYETKETADFDIIRNSPIDYIKGFLSRRQLARLAPHNDIRAVLDYSTGNGRFAVSAKKTFPNAHVDAVDYQAAPPQLLKSQVNAVNYYSQSDFAEQHRQYDLIVLRHVLEHSHHPAKLVKDLSERLAPNGIIYIEVPNMDSGCAKLFGKYWNGYYVPRHIFHYTVDSLTEIIESCGLEAEVGENEMPMMGNTIAIMTGTGKSNFFVQCLGVLLHPLQLVIETLCRSSTCINARCRHPNTEIRA
jgi:2-polyprenyl-3-methyl-5-hydroxy-6-metoxy-1,4-benzoquinol methylase